MISKRKISLLFSCLITLLMFTSSVNAESIEQMEVKPVNVTLFYEDHNATTYEGDAALNNMTFVDELSNKVFIVYSSDNIRTLAKYTNRTMKFNDSIRVNYDTNIHDGFYTVLVPYNKDGNAMRLVSASRSDLTSEEKTYFDNYEEERQDHLAQQIGEDAHSDYTPQKQKQRGVIIGSHGLGYYRSI